MKLYLIFVGTYDSTATILVNRKPGPGYADEDIYKPINPRDLITYLFEIKGYKWRIEK
jgi:hypothetical protein